MRWLCHCISISVIGHHHRGLLISFVRISNVNQLSSGSQRTFSAMRFSVIWKTRFDSRTSLRTSIIVSNSSLIPMGLLERGLEVCRMILLFLIRNELFPIFVLVYYSCFERLFHRRRHPYPLCLSLLGHSPDHVPIDSFDM